MSNAQPTLTLNTMVSTTNKRGANASVSGIAYEKKIAAVCADFKSPHISVPFHTDKDLGGCGADIDVRLNWKSEFDIGLEAKRPTPDWMQMKLYRDTTGKWRGVEGGKIPAASRAIFESIIGSTSLFGGKTPTFLERAVSYDEWTAIKKANPEFSDVYINCADITIADLYRAKGCQYIQVDGKGLFHTGKDVCGFGVPLFTCKQQIRIRIKVHSRGLEKGKAALSVTAAAQPIKLKDLAPSPYSLDNADKMPVVLKM